MDDNAPYNVTVGYHSHSCSSKAVDGGGSRRRSSPAACIRRAASAQPARGGGEAATPSGCGRVFFMGSYGAGTCRSGMGSAAKRRWAGLAIRRAQRVERDTRALSVERPVLANICR